jgi:hypothetical protein
MFRFLRELIELIPIERIRVRYGPIRLIRVWWESSPGTLLLVVSILMFGIFAFVSGYMGGRMASERSNDLPDDPTVDIA